MSVGTGETSMIGRLERVWHEGREGGDGVLRLGPQALVLVADPAGVRHVLAANPEVYVKKSHRLGALLGDGVITAAGEPWRRQRKLLQAHFTGPGVRRYAEAMEGAAQRVVARWRDAARAGTPVDLADETRAYSLDVIWRTATGSTAGLDADTDRELRVIDEVFGALPPFPEPGVPAPDLSEGLARMHATVDRIVAGARSGPAGGGLLGVLLDAGYPPELVRDELITLLAAGYETTATTLTWLFLLLDGAPGEREAALGAGAEGVRALVSEALRLYPVVWMLPRHAAADDVLPDGRRVSAGDVVLSAPWFTHRDPGVWERPGEFRPGRFLPGGERPHAPGAYAPFGLGPRACLGAQFAVRESVVLLERLLPALTPVPVGEAPAPHFGVTVRPAGPVWARVVEHG
ncbi:cytochrome P450 [Streptomyces sp. BI20]|uniref:cytochrome P450 n=1 Tax=Streptomyces sp. BI20 TaxID=3403460 RepID=UPI003C784C34